MMIDITLPHRPSRDWLVAFGSAIGLCAGAMIALIGAVLAWPAGWIGAAAAIAAAASIAIARMRPSLLIRPYELWNRLARAYARRARNALLAICYLTTVTAARRARGGRLGLRRPRPGESTWVRRGTLEADRYPGLDAGSPRRPRGSLRDFVVWVGRSRHLWLAFLLPTLFVLRGLKVGSAPESPDIYTLY